MKVYLRNPQAYVVRQTIWVSLLSAFLKPKLSGVGEELTDQVSMGAFMNRLEEVKSIIESENKRQ